MGQPNSEIVKNKLIEPLIYIMILIAMTNIVAIIIGAIEAAIVLNGVISSILPFHLYTRKKVIVIILLVILDC